MQEEPPKFPGHPLLSGHYLPTCSAQPGPDPNLVSVHPSSPHSCWFHHTFGLSRSKTLGLHSGPQGIWGDSGAHLLKRIDEAGGSPHVATAVSGISGGGLSWPPWLLPNSVSLCTHPRKGTRSFPGEEVESKERNVLSLYIQQGHQRAASPFFIPHAALVHPYPTPLPALSSLQKCAP